MFLLALLFALQVLQSTSHAGETDTFRFEPHPLQVQGQERRAFRFDVPAGGGVTDSVALTNKTDEVRTFRVYGADAAERSEGIEVEPYGANDDGVGAWITMREPDITLLPRESRTIPFTVSRPGDQHAAGLGAVVAEEVREAPKEGGIEVIFRLAIVIQISGDAVGVRVSEPSLDIPVDPIPSRGTATARVSNGTLQEVDAHVTLEVQSLTGSVWTLPPADVRLGPGASEVVEVPWTTVPRWGGVFRVQATAEWEAGAVTTRGPRRLYPPLWLVALAIVAIGVRGLREMRSRRRERTVRPAGTAPEPERRDGHRVNELVGS